MSGGQPVPPRIVEAFAINAGSAYITDPFPVSSQISVTPGRASLNDGFVPLNMTDPGAGGIPPYGSDMNGILFLISAWTAFFAAGQIPTFDATLAADMSGYALGAVVAQDADPTAFWINTVAGNASDPDTGTLGTAGWISSKPLHSAVSLTGAQTNYVLPGPSDYILDVTATGAVTFNSVVAQRDGQRLTIRKVDSSGNAVAIASLGGGVTANEFQIIAGGINLALQYMAQTFVWTASIDQWVQA